MKNKILLFIAIGFVSLNIAYAQNQWVSQNSGTSFFINSVYFVSADTGYVCSDDAAVLKTTNGGNSWNQAGTGPVNSLCFLNAQKGFGANDTALFITQNGGVNWTSCYSNPNIGGINNICFPDKKHGYATAWANYIGNYVLKTNNGGILWDSIYRYNYGLSMVLSMFFKDSLNGFVGCDMGYILKTTNGGNSWIKIPGDTVNAVSFNSIYFPTPDTGFAATEDNGVYRTINGGNTWNHLSFSFPPALYTVWFTDANHGFVGGGDGFGTMTSYQTTNGGNSWTQSASGVQTLNAIFFVDSLPGYAVGSNGTILKYTHMSGIGDNLLYEENINLYPNPATNSLTIETPQNASIEIVNMQGQLVKTISTNGIKTSIDVSTLPGGLYFIKLTTEEGSVVRKFVKE